MSFWTEHGGVKPLGSFKGDILHCAQNDKNCGLIAHWDKTHTREAISRGKLAGEKYSGRAGKAAGCERSI